MAGTAGTLETIALQIGLALQPLKERLAPSQIIAFFAELGLQFPPQLLQPGFVNVLNAAAGAAGFLPNAISQLSAAINSDNKAGILTAGTQLTQKIGAVVAALEQIGTELKSISGSLGMNTAEVNTFAQNLPATLLSYQLITYLESLQPGVVGAANLLGILDYIPNLGVTGDPTHPPYTTRQLQLSRLGNIFTKPDQLLKTLFQWGTPGFNGASLIPRLGTSLWLLGLSSVETSPGPPPWLDSSMFSMKVNPATNPPSLTATLKTFLPGGFDFTLPLSSAWSVHIVSNVTMNGGLQAAIVPPANVTLHSTAALKGQLASDLLAKSPDAAHPIIIIGQTGGSRLQTDSFAFGMGLIITWDSDSGTARAEPQIKAEVKGGKLIIDFSQGDGFIQKILSGVKFDADFNLGGDWDPEHGFRFRGDAGVEILLPLHIDLSVLIIDGLFFKIGVSNEIPIQLGLLTKFAANLGPLKAVVEKIGVNVNITFPSDGGGRLGIADIAFAFKPPNGVGLSLDAGVVKGGGYLYFDFDKEEYAGVLELAIAELVTVKAIGLITTKLPDNSKGFSLLVIITAEFGTGIQLGFGFTLIGLGGLLGLNRTMLPEPIAAGIRSGGINSIMFPPNPVENAPKIISDLRSYFPASVGRFLIGPMAKMGWGTPTLVSLAFGLIIEIPGNIAIIGVLRVNLPAEDVPVVVINVGFIGALEFDKQRLWFYASMFDSRILFLTLEGDMGLLMDYSENSNFVLSVGGFHPMFSPPPLPFPNPRRIRIDVLNNALQRISVESYFAVTSNTVQFGARAELYFGLEVVSVTGHFAFDALFQFSPFKFIIQMSFSVSLNVFGAGLFSIHLKLMLEGPTPWHAKGTGRLTIDLWLFEISVSANFDVTWGDAQNTTLPPIAVVPLLKQEYEKEDNWRAKLPTQSHPLVSLRKLDAQSERLVIHPLGTLQIAQRAVPLNLNIDKVGNRAASDGDNFSVALTSTELAQTGTVPKEKFAIAQYQELSSDEKLTRPAFQKFDAGVELSVTGRQFGSTKAVRRVVRYEAIIIDSNFKRFVIKFFALIGTLFNHFLLGAAVKQSKLSKAYKKALVPFEAEERIHVKEVEYVIASISNNKSIAHGVSFANEAMARDYMVSHIANNPNDAGEVHVIPAFEEAA